MHPCLKKILVLLCCGMAAFAFSPSVSEAENSAPASKDVPLREESLEQESSFRIARDGVTTPHSITLRGSRLSYTATAGYLPLYDERKQKELGQVFYIAYTKEGTASRDLSPRPLTFLFNGGPGSPALWLHMGAFGPKRAPVEKGGLKMPAPPYRVQDNPWTLLPLTDLVFIDPPGTGYSIPPEKTEDARAFWGVAEDVEIMAEFIRLYITKNQRWESPVFLLGESYGGIRASGLAPVLQDTGIAPSGIILVAPAVSYGDILGSRTNERPFVHRIPTMALAARYHGKETPGLKELSSEALWEHARTWAQKTYLPALWEGGNLESGAKERCAEEMAQLVGLRRETLKDWDLRLPQWIFAGDLCDQSREILSIYDTRITGPGGAYRFREDPLMANITPPFATAFLNYLHKDLNFVTDLTYVISGNEAHANWNWKSGLSHGKYGYPETVGDLGTALRRDPHLEIFVAMGTYDLVCPPESIRYSLTHMDLPEDRAQEALHFHRYEGGHMMYLEETVLEKLRNDLGSFYEKLLP